MSNPIPESGHGPACDPAKDAFWRRTLADFAASGRNICEFCRERGLGESAFYAWRRTIAQRDGLLAGRDRKTAAAEEPAVSKKPAAVKKPTPAFLPVKVKPAAAAGGEALRVELRGGRVAGAAGATAGREAGAGDRVGNGRRSRPPAAAIRIHFCDNRSSPSRACRGG